MATERKYKASTNDMQPKLCDHCEDWELHLTNNDFELTLTGVGSEGAFVKDIKKYCGTFTEDENSITLHANHFDHKFDLEYWNKSWFQRNKHEHNIDTKFKESWTLQKEENNLKPIGTFAKSSFNMVLKMQ